MSFLIMDFHAKVELHLQVNKRGIKKDKRNGNPFSTDARKDAINFLNMAVI